MQRLVALHTSLLPANIEFMGMADYVSESIQDLLAGQSENFSDSDSSEGSHHSWRECFMANTPEGHVADGSEGGTTLVLQGYIYRSRDSSLIHRLKTLKWAVAIN